MAVNVVALTNVVGCGAPFQSTTELLTKFVPVSVIVNAGTPALTVFGEIEVSVGTGLFAALTLKLIEFDGPPPGFGLFTKTAGVPAVATSAARIVAVNCVELTNVVVLFAPPKFTTELETKFVPFTVNVNAIEPAATLVGETDDIVGTGFVAAVTLKLTEFDAPPPGVGFVTITAGVPTVATSIGRIEAVTCVELTNVVPLVTPPKLRVAPLTKPVPLIVNVNAVEPAAIPVGDSEVIVGTGLFTWNVTLFVDVPPPGVAFVTVTKSAPDVAMSLAKIAAVTCVELTSVVTRAM